MLNEMGMETAVNPVELEKSPSVEGTFETLQGGKAAIDACLARLSQSGTLDLPEN